MPEQLHTVTITGTADGPKLEFDCAGGRDARCHDYPGCECEGWDWDADEECAHSVPHGACWMVAWFANGDTAPSASTLGDVDYRVGMSGPISATTCEDTCCVEWEFIEEAKRG